MLDEMFGCDDDDDDIFAIDDIFFEKPSVKGAGPDGVMEILKSHPTIIRDVSINILRAEIETMSPKDRSFVMSERKALRNRLSAQKCAKARQVHIEELQKKCATLSAENARLKKLLKSQ